MYPNKSLIECFLLDVFICVAPWIVSHLLYHRLYVNTDMYQPYLQPFENLIDMKQNRIRQI